MHTVLSKEYLRANTTELALLPTQKEKKTRSRNFIQSELVQLEFQYYQQHFLERASVRMLLNKYVLLTSSTSTVLICTPLK